MASTTGSGSPPKPDHQGRSGVKAPGGGPAQESGPAKARQSGGPQSATAQGPQVFHLSGRGGRSVAVGTQGRAHRPGNPAGRVVFAAHQSTPRALRGGARPGSLQRVAGRGASLLRTQELPGSAPRASPPPRPGGQPRGLVLFGLLVERAFGPGMARQGRDRRGSAHPAPPADHTAGLLANGQASSARTDDSNP